MKLLSYTFGNRAGYGAMTEAGIVPLSDHFADVRSLRHLMEAGRVDAVKSLDLSSMPTIPADEVTFLPPVPDSEKILCVGMNYRTHAQEIGAKIPDFPPIFSRFNNSIVGHRCPVFCPVVSEQFDFEGELAVIVGRRCRNVTARDAHDMIAGYACFAENSVRDYQRHSATAMVGKNFFASGAMGPWMVTSDEISDPSRLEIKTRLNGIEVQRGTTSDMIYGISALIEYLSTFTELVPGDIIVTGTPAGVGSARKPPLWMKPGDRLEVEIARIGTLANSVVLDPTASKSPT